MHPSVNPPRRHHLGVGGHGREASEVEEFG